MILHTPYMEIWEDIVEQPNGKKTKYYIRRKAPFSIIIPIHEDKKITMVRQYRYTVKSISLEFPMGYVEGKSPKESAIVELRQEAGLIASKLTLLCNYWSGPGHTDQETYVYLAENLDQVLPQPEDGEFFDIERYSVEEVSHLIDSGKIKDVHTIAAFHLLEQFLRKQ